MQKICRCCNLQLPLDEFYAHPRMQDGHLNICKNCVKSRVRKYRENNLEKVRAYDRARAKTSIRKHHRYMETMKRRQEVDGYTKGHNSVYRAVKRGIFIRPDKCQVCGKICKPEGHHIDYAQSLAVIWLCRECHCLYHIGKTEKAEKIRKAVNQISANMLRRIF